MGMEDDRREHQSRQFGLAETIGRLRPPTHSPRRYVGRAIAPISGTPPAWVNTQPLDISGGDLEGSAATLTVDATVTVPVLCLENLPAVGGNVLAKTVGGHWVATVPGPAATGDYLTISFSACFDCMLTPAYLAANFTVTINRGGTVSTPTVRWSTGGTLALGVDPGDIVTVTGPGVSQSMTISGAGPHFTMYVAEVAPASLTLLLTDGTSTTLTLRTTYPGDFNPNPPGYSYEEGGNPPNTPPLPSYWSDDTFPTFLRGYPDGGSPGYTTSINTIYYYVYWCRGVLDYAVVVPSTFNARTYGSPFPIGPVPFVVGPSPPCPPDIIAKGSGPTSYGSRMKGGPAPWLANDGCVPCSQDITLSQGHRSRQLDRELVVAKYREDVRWVNDAPLAVLLYDKCPTDIGFAEHVVHRQIPNLGREAGTMLRHIVDNYRDLAAWTYFVQGTTHSGIELFGRLATTYPDTTGLTAHYQPGFPSIAAKSQDLITRHGEYYVHHGLADHHGDRKPEENRVWLKAVWSHWFACPQPREWRYAYAAELAVPRHRITARPLAFWRYALDRVNATSCDPNAWDSDPGNAWSLELCWLYLFGDPKRYPVKSGRSLSLLSRTLRLGKATATQMMAGNPIAPVKVQEARKATCFACPMHDHQADICLSCGCTRMNIKRSWATSVCPEGKWER